MKNLLIIFFLFIITSCNSFEFIHDDSDNLINPLFEKTKVKTTGIELVFMNSYLPVVFGNNKIENFNLSINIEEKKTKRSVETNQATSNLRYELSFFYSLVSDIKNCITYEKEILSSFSIIPKSSGYDYGTDASLEKKYELAIIESLNRYISLLSEVDIYNCK
tara:strand:- start:2412 stop:2900 length:489 start_codon:yes stop_codon:yes gene_type:complete